MNTRDLAALGDWDESQLTTLVGRFAQVYRRLPSYPELVTMRRALSQVGRLAECDNSERDPATIRPQM